MPDYSKDQEHRQEAARLTQLPRDEQRQIVAMIRQDGRNPKAPKRERELNLARARALERFLGLVRKGKRKI